MLNISLITDAINMHKNDVRRPSPQYKYGGYGDYHTEFTRLKQEQLLTDEWATRKLEQSINAPGVNNVDTRRRRPTSNETAGADGSKSTATGPINCDSK